MGRSEIIEVIELMELGNWLNVGDEGMGEVNSNVQSSGSDRSECGPFPEYVKEH